MKFSIIKMALKDIPSTVPRDGKILYDFVLSEKPKKILELGFAHGVSTCYMAAALQEIQSGRITTIDKEEARKRRPSLEELLNKLQFSEYVESIYANNSYTWELMKILERKSNKANFLPLFDFCFIDGAHTWETDGFAFFLVEKLLKVGGWILFDDMDWTFNSSITCRKNKLILTMDDDEKSTPHIEKVFNLLVRQHPNFKNFKVIGNWGWAQKVEDRSEGSLEVLNGEKVERVYLQQPVWLDIRRILKKLCLRSKH